MKRNHQIIALGVTLIVGLFLVFYFFVPMIFSADYKTKSGTQVATTSGVVLTASSTKPVASEIAVTHIVTPEPLKAIYMSACVATVPSWRVKLSKLVETTELNAIVIDVKDYTGTISYYPTDPTLAQTKGSGCRVQDMKKFVAFLHEKGIYVIARVTVFQDPYYTKLHPELAVKKASDGTVWKDHKGLAFIDVSAKPYWEYIALLARDTYAQGFDEINFDYIRFPSDGNMKDVAYPWTGTTTKPVALERFFTYLEQSVKPSGAVISADLFGMTTTNKDDLNIGQVLEPALRHFDYVSPMVYPSHYPPNFNNWKNPNEHVYGVVNYSMSRAVVRAREMVTLPVASTTPTGTSTVSIPSAEELKMMLKLRPWLQDFSYGGIYGPAEVRAQIKATYDAGLTSWLLWDPKNLYTVSALDSR
jgi:hypothetical protein